MDRVILEPFDGDPNSLAAAKQWVHLLDTLTSWIASNRSNLANPEHWLTFSLPTFMVISVGTQLANLHEPCMSLLGAN